MENKEHTKNCIFHTLNEIKKTNPHVEPDYVECNCDGYHTFTELYAHRATLFITLCKTLKAIDVIIEKVEEKDILPWRSKLHSDGTMYDGWFILGLYKEKGKQITYHIPIDLWEDTNFAETLKCAPEFDGHTPDDVIGRLSNL